MSLNTLTFFTLTEFKDGGTAGYFPSRRLHSFSPSSMSRPVVSLLLMLSWAWPSSQVVSSNCLLACGNSPVETSSVLQVRKQPFFELVWLKCQQDQPTSSCSSTIVVEFLAWIFHIEMLQLLTIIFFSILVLWRLLDVLRYHSNSLQRYPRILHFHSRWR